MCISRFSLPARAAAAALLLVATPLGLSAQARWSVSVHGGMAFPTGDFADDEGAEAGLATLGFSLGSDLAMRIDAVPGLSWVSTVQGVTFGVDEDFIGDLATGVEVDVGRYWGILAKTGLRYGIGEASPRFHFAGQVVAGTVKAPNATFSGMGQTAELVSSWMPAKGYSLGVGSEIGDRLTIDLRYEGLINTEIEAEFRDGGTTETFQGEQPMAWVRVAVGIRVR